LALRVGINRHGQGFSLFYVIRGKGWVLKTAISAVFSKKAGKKVPPRM
jgi:hypothetical protein